jgi:tRNA A37 threonylcarbamoyladenosine dehydratase
MGEGGKLDPSLVQIADLKKSYNCKLARNLRKRLRKLGINGGFKVVFSPEDVNPEAVISTPFEQNKKSNVGTISYMPALFGIYCASQVIRDLIEK